MIEGECLGGRVSDGNLMMAIEQAVVGGKQEACAQLCAGNSTRRLLARGGDGENECAPLQCWCPRLVPENFSRFQSNVSEEVMVHLCSMVAVHKSFSVEQGDVLCLGIHF